MAKNRTKNIKKDMVLTVGAVIALVLCALTAVFGVLYRIKLGTYYSLEKVQTVQIDNAEQLKTLGETIFNNNVELISDIHITDKDFRLGTNDRPFTGKFNGNGHRITMDYGKVGNGQSLFGCIAENGVIENVAFDFGNVEVNGSTFAGVAQINYGVIRNCSIHVEQLVVSQSGISQGDMSDLVDGMFSPLVNINGGTICNVVVSCNFVAQGGGIKEERITFGGVCSYNYKTCKNNVLNMDFNGFACTVEFDVLTGKVINTGIAAMCAANVEKGELGNFALRIKDGVYSLDKTNAIVVAEKLSAVFNDSVVFTKLEFDHDYWQFTSNGNMELKVREATK